MDLAKAEEILRPIPDAQIDINIVAYGKCITETTIDVFAEHFSGDASVGESAGWVIHRVMLGKADITNEIDLIELQQHLSEIL